MVNVGKYSIHGAYGSGISYKHVRNYKQHYKPLRVITFSRMRRVLMNVVSYKL